MFGPHISCLILVLLLSRGGTRLAGCPTACTDDSRLIIPMLDSSVDKLNITLCIQNALYIKTKCLPTKSKEVMHAVVNFIRFIDIQNWTLW